MPAPRGDKYWAKWSYDFCQVAKVSTHPHRDFGAIIDLSPKTVSALVHRMRARGFITPREQGFQLTALALEALAKVKDPGNVVAFDVNVRAKSKTEALAEVWDVIAQLESWDPRTGAPFKLDNARIKKIGQAGE